MKMERYLYMNDFIAFTPFIFLMLAAGYLIFDMFRFTRKMSRLDREHKIAMAKIDADWKKMEEEQDKMINNLFRDPNIPEHGLSERLGTETKKEQLKRILRST